MLPKPNPEALAEQLFLLTLATEKALAQEDWDEASALFDRRDDILLRLESLDLSPGAKQRLGDVQRLEAGLAARLKEWRTSLVDQMVVGRRRREAAISYNIPETLPIYESAG